jgi:hypothetical protein
MKKILLFILVPILNFGQTKIGAISGKSNDEQSGQSISFSSDGLTIAIGSAFNDDQFTNAGLIRVFHYDSGLWKQVGNDIYGERKSEFVGRYMTLSSDGKFIITCGFEDVNGGKYVKMYRNVSGKWIKVNHNIVIENRPSCVVLSADQNVLAFGFAESDRVTVYRNNLGTWDKIGDTLYGEEKFDNYGYSVSLSSDGSKIAIGGYHNNNSVIDSGHVRVFLNSSDNWVQIGADIDGKVKNGNSGYSVSLSADGNTLAVGAPGRYMNTTFGSAYVYRNVNGSWKQVGATLSGTQLNNHFGLQVALSSDGSILALSDDQNGESTYNAGQVRIFKNVSDTWKQVGNNINGEGYDLSGQKIALSPDGSLIAISSLDDGEGINRGEVRIYSLSNILNTDKFVMDNFNIYPNPTSNIVNINLNENLELRKVNIYNTLGQLIKTEKSNIISVGSLSHGTYYFEIITDKGKGTKTVLIK